MAYPILNANKVYLELANMISRIEENGDNIKSKSVSRFAEKAKVEGAQFGDTVIYRDFDTLYSREFDPDNNNVLQVEQIANIKEQPIVMNKFRQVGLTLPTSFLAKQAMDGEGCWASFTSIIEGMISRSRDLTDGRGYNVFLGTDETAKTVEFTLGTGTETKDYCKQLKDLLDSLEEGSREFNDYGFMKSYRPEDVICVLNSAYASKFIYQELPGDYHIEELKKFVSGDTLNKAYFGDLQASHATAVEGDFAAEPLNIYDANGKVVKFYYPGDELPAGTDLTVKYVDKNGAVKAKTDDDGNTVYASTYKVNDKIICKIYSKLPPFMSGIDLATEFNNAKNFSKNMYLTTGHNTLEHLKGEASITIVAK